MAAVTSDFVKRLGLQTKAFLRDLRTSITGRPAVLKSRSSEEKLMGSVGKPNLPPAVAPEGKNLPTGKVSPAGLAAERPAAWLGPSLHIKGDITGAEDLLIDGSVEGMIQLDDGTLTVGASAKLKADISARDVVVYGCIKGNVRAAGMIEIKKDGSVTGNLTTVQIMIREGADFKGSIEIDTSATKEADKNVDALAAPAGAEGLGAKSDAQDTWTTLERPN